MNNPQPSTDIAKELAEKTYQELGYDPKTGTFSRPSPLPRSESYGAFRIRAIEKTQRQWTSDQGYKASASWQTASLLRDLTLLWTTEHLGKYTGNYGKLREQTGIDSRVNPGTIRRLRAQMEDAARSMVSTFEEGWGRPSTKEFLDFIGFSQASLVELRGDFERCMTDGLIQTGTYGRLREHTGGPMGRVGIPTPSRDFPYPPVASRKFPEKYGKLREKLREFTGREIHAKDLTYELFIELANKTSHLFKRTVEGLWGKLSRDEQAALKEQLANLWSNF